MLIKIINSFKITDPKRNVYLSVFKPLAIYF